MSDPGGGAATRGRRALRSPTVQPADIGRLVTPGDPRVSPDGRRVAVVVTRVDLDADRYRSAVWLAAADGSTPPRPLTAGEDSDANPAWSPDGTRLAFTRSAAGRHRLLVMPIGEPGEPVVLAERAEPLGGLAWSPDGSRLAFVSREPRPAAEPITRHPGAPGESVSKPPRRIDRLFGKLDGEGWIVDRPRAVFVVGTDTPARPRLLVAHRYDVGAPTWSPDGRTLAVSTVRDVPDADLTLVEALHLVDVDGERAGTLRPLTGELTTSLSHPSFSPDGTRIAVLSEETTIVPSFGRVAVVPTAGGDPTVLTSGLDRQAAPFVGVRAPIWRGDDELVFALEEHGTQPLYRVSVDGGTEPGPVVGGTRAVVGYDEAAGTLAVVSTSPTERPELSVVRDGLETRLTAFSAGFHRDVPLDAPEHLRAASAGGGEIDVWVLRPRDAAGEPVPSCCPAHGGPMTQYPTACIREFALWIGAGATRSSEQPARLCTGEAQEFHAGRYRPAIGVAPRRPATGRSGATPHASSLLSATVLVVTTRLGSTSRASSGCSAAPRRLHGGRGLSPAIRPTFAPMSESPIIAMTVPVTSGGKNADDHREGFRDDQPEDARDDHGAVDVGQTVPAAVRRGDDDHRVEDRERGAGDDRQPHAQDPPDAGRLDDRGDAAHQQVGADEDRDVAALEAHRGPDDERHGDRPGVHDEQVLQAQHEQSGQREDLVHGVDGVLRMRR